MDFNAEKLTKWSKEIHENAVAHGWHEEKHSPNHYLGLVMTEVAEAVEADRKDRKFKLSCCVPDDEQYFVGWYNEWVKGTIDEEFADIVIRLLDMAYEIHGEDKEFIYDRFIGTNFQKKTPFIVTAWNFVKKVLNFEWFDINYSIRFIYEWAESLGIDLDQHIEWKMRYNTFRDYKHGGKKY